jgi:hypothetical protein
MEIAAIIGILVLLIGVPVVVVNRDLLFHRAAAKRTRVEAPLPFLIIPSYLGASETVPSGVNRRNPPSFAEREAEDTPASFAPPEPAARTQRTKSFDSYVGPVKSDDTSELDEADEMERAEEVSPDATVVFNRPVDEPMQILPGRLQVISGEPSTDDLLFFSRLGEPPRIFVGRDAGPPHRHITLRSPTVSRRHARIDFDSGTWTITNLSQTNPVIVNDRVLSNGSSARKLADGDRIELGEVALRFRSS